MAGRRQGGGRENRQAGILVGNLNNPRTLFQGTPEDVYRQARYAIEAGVHIIGPECAVPLSTPLANLQAIPAAVGEGY